MDILDNKLDSLKGMFKKLRKEEDNETYSLRIITEWLKSNNISYTYVSSPAVDRYLLYEHGVVATIGDKKISIQTHPIIAGYAFAETLVFEDMLSDTRHKTPEILFEFLTKMLTTEIIEEERKK